jgi:hypothetical protein
MSLARGQRITEVKFHGTDVEPLESANAFEAHRNEIRQVMTEIRPL